MVKKELLVIAILETETVIFEIKNQVGYFSVMQGHKVYDYESFHVRVVRKKTGRLMHDIILYDQSPELCTGNIQCLVGELEAYLNGSLKEIQIETMEPDFEIIIKNYADTTSEFQFWINQGSEGGAYSDDAIGIRLVLGREELEVFHQQLTSEYIDRKIMDYKLKLI
jgi:hypothetical protein